MHRINIVFATLLFSATSAFAAEPISEATYPAMDSSDPSLYLQFGVAMGKPVDVHMSSSVGFRGIGSLDIDTDEIARPYFAFGLPIAVMDKWSVSVNGDISFTGSDDLGVDNAFFNNTNGALIDVRDFQSTDKAYWGSVDLLVSYDVGDYVSSASDARVFGGVRYDYGFVRANNPLPSLLSASADFMHYRQETITPVVGINTTFKGATQGIFGGDVHLSAMAGPIVWGRSDYRDNILTGPVFVTNMLHHAGDLNGGYFWKLYGDVDVVSREAFKSAGMDGGISLFGQVSQTNATGSGMMEDYSTAGGFATPRSFDIESNSLVWALGVMAKFRF